MTRINKMNQKTKTILKSALIVIGFSFSVSALAVWYKPDVNPLSNNTPAPINAGGSAQMKSGALIVTSFRDMGLALFDGNVEVTGGIKVGPSTSAGGRDSEMSNRSALLELNSTTQGLVLPRMTQAQRDAMYSPVGGTVIFQTDNTPGLRVYNGVTWVSYQDSGKNLLP